MNLQKILAVGAFVFVQRVGMLGRGLRLLQWLGVKSGGPHAAGLISVDRALAASYGRRPGAVLCCGVIHLLGEPVRASRLGLERLRLRLPPESQAYLSPA